MALMAIGAFDGKGLMVLLVRIERAARRGIRKLVIAQLAIIAQQVHMTGAIRTEALRGLFIP